MDQDVPVPFASCSLSGRWVVLVGFGWVWFGLVGLGWVVGGMPAPVDRRASTPQTQATSWWDLSPPSNNFETVLLG